MIENAYPFEETQASIYRFNSVGRKEIIKEVAFILTSRINTVNMGFGDVQPDGSIDDKSISNNGDIVKVIGTIVQIMIDFTNKSPDVEIFFTGSTPERSKLYFRIVRNHYEKFNKIFTINILEPKRDGFIKRPFETGSSGPFLGFLIKRIY